MDLYFDKENLFSFVSQKDKDDYVDCSRLVRRQLHVVYGFEKEEIEKWDESLRLCFLNDLVDGRGWKEEEDCYKEDYLETTGVKSDFVLYLLNDNHVADISENRIKGKVGEELQIIKKLFCGNDYDLHCEYNLQDKSSFPSWEKLELDGHALPCSDIIIRDRYLFDNQYELVKTNLYELLKVLTKSNAVSANVVIITIGNNTTNWKNYINEIKTQCNVNITFALAYPNPSGKGFVATIPHDRIILTNYRRYVSGDSLVFFYANGDVLTTGDVFKVDSVADRNTQSLADAFIKNTQELCDKIRKKEFGNIKYILGDKKSNLIKF